jgi:hypothetical protein
MYRFCVRLGWRLKVDVTIKLQLNNSPHNAQITTHFIQNEDNFSVMTVEISTGSITLTMLSSYREGLSRYAYFIYLYQDLVFNPQNICHF